MDAKSTHRQRGQELRALEGEVRGRRQARLLGAQHLQAHLQGGSRGDYQSADLRPLPQ